MISWAATMTRVYLAYTNFVNMLEQRPVIRQLLPLAGHVRHTDRAA
jgi:F0F1-type ATP synthase gamma subunit